MPGVTNAEILAALQGAGMDQAWRHTIDAELHTITAQIVALTRAVEVSTSKDAKRDSCPFRDDIISSANNKVRIGANEKGIAELRLAMARSGMFAGAAGGGTLMALGSVAFVIGKAAGWW